MSGNDGDRFDEEMVRRRMVAKEILPSCERQAKKHGWIAAYAGIGIMAGVQEFGLKIRFNSMTVRVLMPVITGSCIGLYVAYDRLHRCRVEREYRARLQEGVRKSLKEDWPSS